SIRKIIFGNMGLKALAVVISLSLWFYVTYRGQSDMVIDAPIELKNIPKGLELVKQNVKKVSVYVSGNERFLKAIKPMDAKVSLDLSRVKKGDATCFVDKSSISLPPPIKVLRIEPSSVKLTLDETITKVVPVQSVVVGTPQRGFRVRSLHLAPSTVLLEGPREEVEKISVLRTEPVDISGRSSGLTQTVRVNMREGLRAKVSEVSVKIVIGR
ncbi:MAG: hypothetical protein HGA78_12000, partial [Nitrospirales bacterium]|nr:hypothetical protein [Nitrospirales bacterium]